MAYTYSAKGETTMGKRKIITPMPTTIETKEDRGKALEHFIDTQFGNQTAFATISGVPRPTVSKYCNGQQDLLNAPQFQIERILTHLGMSDTEAWQVFNIPPEQREDNWRTFRLPPMGHGKPPNRERHYNLKKPLQGGLPIGGLTVIVDEDSKEGVQLVKHANEFFAVTASSSPVGELLGRIVRIEFPVNA